MLCEWLIIELNYCIILSLWFVHYYRLIYHLLCLSYSELFNTWNESISLIKCSLSLFYPNELFESALFYILFGKDSSFDEGFVLFLPWTFDINISSFICCFRTSNSFFKNSLVYYSLSTLSFSPLINYFYSSIYLFYYLCP